MVNHTVILIKFIDRFGLGFEVFELLKKYNINVLGMEAKANQNMTIKFRNISNRELDSFIKDIQNIDGVIDVNMQEQMPYEQREEQLKTIINLVSEGIIAINKYGVITHINEVACRTLYVSQDKVIGEEIGKILDPNIPILDTIKTGDSYNLKEIKIRKNKKVFHYLTSGSPIINDSGNIIGAVATIKDYQQVEQIISRIDSRKKLNTFDDIIYQSQAMRKLIETAKTVSKGDSSILIRGESGTGKELFARAIHMESNRRDNPFIAINCAALPESLLESELFGYEEGAFTGANKGGRKGLFEQANTGTLFLDEIGEISPQIQVRLLRVLQENAIRRVGGDKEVPVDVRIITATHRNLEDMIIVGSFREDLYYRLNVIPLNIPPLRERSEDIPLLAQHLIRSITKKLNKLEVRLSKDAIKYLINEKWPGNVRQLENTLERVLNIIDKDEITLEHIKEWANIKQRQEKEHIVVKENNSITINIPIDGDWPHLKEIVSNVEKQVLERVLQDYNSSRKAGRVLGVSNTTILNKLKAYKIK